MIAGKEIIDAYIKWFREGIKVVDKDGFTEITTPFLDSHNDHIQLYVQQEGDAFILSDDGWTINDLKSIGCDLRSTKRKEILQGIVHRMGVDIDGDVLLIKAQLSDLPLKKHALIQAILSVNDMMMLSGSRVSGLFMDDVYTYLKSKKLFGTKNIQLKGRSGLSHKFDIVLPETDTRPETLIQTVNNPYTNAVQLTLFGWSDIKSIRETDSQLVVFLNDTNKSISASVINAFEEYEINAYPWARREDALQKLLA